MHPSNPGCGVRELVILLLFHNLLLCDEVCNALKGKSEAYHGEVLGLK